MMKKFVLLFSFLFSSVLLFAGNYLISFSGSGSATTVDSVFVENLTTGTKLALNGADILNLTFTTGLNNPDSEFTWPELYPNPMQDQSKLLFNVTEGGIIQVKIYDLSGRMVVKSSDYLLPGRHQFVVSGLKSGIYTVGISGSNLNYSLKLVSDNSQNVEAGLSYVSMVKEGAGVSGNPVRMKSASSTIAMAYNTGDRLKITGKSGIYRTVVTDVPTQSKTVAFAFVPCTDGEGINYAVVKIGTQTWMAENLKTTKYKDGVSIPNVPDNTAWASQTTGAYCLYNNDNANKTAYGLIYNWYTVNTGKLCPTGWHVPSETEWTSLSTYLGGSGVAGAKMKETGASHWLIVHAATTNESGFTALPGGIRFANGTFDAFKAFGYFWSSTIYTSTFVWNWYVYYSGAEFEKSDFQQSYGMSVRCIKD
jgi:uncharacterized protein (TIGR02145 family)